MAEWKQFKLAIPGKDYLEQVREVLETLLVYLEVLKAILETIKAFLVDFGNPIRALVEALIKLILALFEALKQTGLYGYFDIPVPDVDPNFNRNAGGSVAFVERFKGSLYDTKDPWRPQPVNLFNEGGYIILMVDASNIVRLIRLIRILLRFFGKEFTSPRYAAPANVKVLPVGDAGDPILAVAKVFSSDIKSFVVEWSSPTQMRNPDPGFLDMVGTMANEFIPPKFLIEVSNQDPSQEIDEVDLTHDNATGVVMYQRDSGFEVRGKRLKRRERLRDSQNEPIIKFQRYIAVDMSDPTFWIGGVLGKYRYIFNDAVKDQTYWLRLRAYSGSFRWKDEDAGLLDFSQSVQTWQGNGNKTFYWPYVDNDEPVMGMPSGIYRIRLPNIPANFDVLENLKRVFQTAFSLDFHQPVNATRDQGGTITFPTFDANGYPTGTTANKDVGRGSLANLAGPLAAFDSLPVVGKVSSTTSLTTEFKPDEITGEVPKMPWQMFKVRFHAARLAVTVASALLQAGSGAIQGFQAIMQGPFPAGPYSTGGATLGGKTTLEQALFALTNVSEDDTITDSQALAYGEVYSKDPAFRLNVLAAINFIKSFTLGGYPPDWVSIAIFRDIIPWGAGILYAILNAIQSLLDAFNGVIQEIKDFIDLLIRKIDALERFIKFLISLMEYVMMLDVECYMLNSGTLTGGLPQWIETVDSATGDAPPNQPGGYSAGIVLGYVAPDVSAISAAFKLIFGA